MINRNNFSEGERPDIALANDKAWGTIQENARKHFADLEISLERRGEYAVEPSENVQKLSEVILRMIDEDINELTIEVAGIYKDVDIDEAVNDACVQIGLSSDDYKIENVSTDENYLQLVMNMS